MWLMFYEVDFRVHVHEIEGDGEEREDDEKSPYKEYALPCREFSRYWDALHRRHEDAFAKVQRGGVGVYCSTQEW